MSPRKRYAVFVCSVALSAMLALPAACGGSAVGSGGAAGAAGTNHDADVDNAGTAGTGAVTDAAPDADVPPGAACDPLAQNCAGPDGKCSLVRLEGDSGASLVAVCVDDGGSLGEGETCALTDPGSGMWAVPDAVGHDDCKAGYYCAVAGVFGSAIRKTGRCRAMCTSYTQCPPSETCINALWCDWPPDAAGGAKSRSRAVPRLTP